MDQLLLPFVVDDNTRYGKTGTNEIWVANGQSRKTSLHCQINHSCL